MARFVHSTMNSETISFALRIDKFSNVVRRGHYQGPKFRGEGSDSKWSLTVYASEGAEYEDFIDIRLRRNYSDGKDQFVELKVTIDDYLGSSSLSKTGQFCFTGTKNIHKVLSVSNTYLSEFQRLRFIPNDTLTIRGKMTVYEETEVHFESEDDFDRSLENSNSARNALVRWILWKALIYLAGAAGVVAIVATILYVIKNVVLPFLQNFVLPSIIVLNTMFLFWLIHKESNALYYSPKPNEYSGRRMGLVPAANGVYGHTMQYYSGGKNYNKPLKHGGGIRTESYIRFRCRSLFWT